MTIQTRKNSHHHLNQKIFSMTMFVQFVLMMCPYWILRHFRSVSNVAKKKNNNNGFKKLSQILIFVYLLSTRIFFLSLLYYYTHNHYPTSLSFVSYVFKNLPPSSIIITTIPIATSAVIIIVISIVPHSFIQSLLVATHKT